MRSKDRNTENYRKTAYGVFIILALLIFAWGLRSGSSATRQVYISEVCPHNNSVIYDSVGFYHDYIVVKNAGDEPVNLEGYGLSDDSDDIMKFVFPDAELEAGGEVLVWADAASAYYDKEGNAYTDDEALYTGFSVSDHEMIYLSEPDGYVVDSLRLPAMKIDTAYLRNKRNDKGVIGLPAELEEVPPVISDSVAPPVFSVPSGYYDGPFELAIDGMGNNVFYTVDGYDPCTHGTGYEAPVVVYDRSEEPNFYSSLGPTSAVIDMEEIPPVSKAFIVRAVAASPNGSFSRETSAVYFVGENIRNICSGTYTLSLISDPEGIFSGKRGIYVTGNIWEMNSEKAEEIEADLHFVPANYNMRGREWRRAARATLFDGSGNLLYDQDVDINIRGGYSRSALQKSFAVKPARAGERVFDGLIPGSGDSLDLRTGGEDEAFLTNIRDVVNNTVASDMSLAPQRSLCCQVYLDGEYWGCYNLQDHLNESFVEARYGVPAENVNIIKNFEARSGLQSDLDQYLELEEFVKTNDLADAANYARFCEMVDIESLMDYYCAEMYYGNFDAYINNVAMWRSRNPGLSQYEDCKWRYLLFDTDESDSIWGDSSDLDSFAHGNWNGVNPDTELFFSNLSKNSDFREAFAKHFNELLADDFSYGRVEPLINSLEAEYTDPMVRSCQRFGKVDYSSKNYADNIREVREFFRKRGDYMSGYIKEHMGEY